MAGLEAGLWSDLDELSSLWSSSATFEANDPTLADLGYASWLDATERA